MAKYWSSAILALLASSARLDAAPEHVEPKPRIDLGTLFGPDSYPSLAYLIKEIGTVVAGLAIDPEGTVTACRIVTSSNSTSLDAATCKIMTGRKASFSPARDASGKPVAGSYDLKVHWALPEALPSPLESRGQRLTLLLSNKAVIKRCELRDMPGNVGVEAMTMCAGFREMFAAMFEGGPETSPPGDVELLILLDQTVGQAAPLSGSMPVGMTLLHDVGSEFVVQADGTRTDCTPVTTLVATTSEDDASEEVFYSMTDRFAKHQGPPIKMREHLRIAYRLVGK